MDSMRDLFEDLFQGQPIDPIAAARRSLRSPSHKRFYDQAHVAAADETFQILLDGRPVKTPGRRVLAAPTPALAQAIADEWQAQAEVIDPSTMPLTRLANTIIDGVASAPREVAADIARYLGSDLLVYRLRTPDGLVERQVKYWDPILAWARDTLGACFVLADGVTFVQQPASAVEAATRAIPIDPWRLGALHVITTLTGSALIALALASDALSLDDAWVAAHVDEDWNMDLWGRDDVALARRAVHFEDMQAAATTLRLAGASHRAPSV
jgi:chaperone required for assembly of F1-ATPase